MNFRISDFLLTFFISFLPVTLFSYLFFFNLISFPFWLNLTLWIITGILSLPMIVMYCNMEKEGSICFVIGGGCAEVLFFTAPVLSAYRWLLTSCLLGVWLLFSLIALFECHLEVKRYKRSSYEAWDAANHYREKIEREDSIKKKLKDSLR